MKHIQTLNTRDMAKSLQNGGCGDCQPALREEVIFTRTGFLPGLPFTKKALPVLFM